MMAFKPSDTEPPNGSLYGTNPFDNLPDELILHIIRAGSDNLATEMQRAAHDLYEEDIDPALQPALEILDRGGAINRRAKPFTHLASQISSRFRANTSPSSWNADLFYVYVSFKVYQYRVEEQEDLCAQIAQVLHALSNAEGCDIYASLTYLDETHDTALGKEVVPATSSATRLAARGISMLYRYRKQVAWFDATIISPEMIEWLMGIAAWFSESQRLEILELHLLSPSVDVPTLLDDDGGNEGDRPSRAAPFDIGFHITEPDWKKCESLSTIFYALHPRLVRLEDIPYGPNVSELNLGSMTTDDSPLNWSSFIKFLTSMPRLAKIILRELYNVVPPRPGCDSVTILPSVSNLTVLGSDDALLLLLSTLKFPIISSAQLDIIPGNSGHVTEIQLAQIMINSSWKNLKRLEFASASSIAYSLLDACGIGELESINLQGYLAVEHIDFRGTRNVQIYRDLPVGSLRNIVTRDLQIHRADGLHSITKFSRTVDPHKVKSLHITACSWNGENLDFDDKGGLVELPLLTSVTIKSIDAISDAWVWLSICNLPKLEVVKVSRSNQLSGCNIELEVSNDALWPANVSTVTLRLQNLDMAEFLGENGAFKRQNFLSPIFTNTVNLKLEVQALDFIDFERIPDGVLRPHKGLEQRFLLLVEGFLAPRFNPKGSNEDIERREKPEAQDVWRQLETIVVHIGSLGGRDSDEETVPPADAGQQITSLSCAKLDFSDLELKMLKVQHRLFEVALLHVAAVRLHAGCPLKRVTIVSLLGERQLVVGGRFRNIENTASAATNMIPISRA
jgi:hypothetical protein